MQSRSRYFIAVLTVGIVWASAVVWAGANDKANATNAASARAEGDIRRCGDTFQGNSAKLNRCISDRLQRLSQQLNRAGVGDFAPKAAPEVAKAARQLRPKKRKRAGVQVMNRARSVMRSLAATSRKGVRIYNRLARVFAVAASVISAKGGV